jgi:hypothetical protein
MNHPYLPLYQTIKYNKKYLAKHFLRIYIKKAKKGDFLSFLAGFSVLR